MTYEPIWRRYARLFGPDPAADVRDELQFHFEQKVEELRNQGLDDDQARAEAVRLMGDVTSLQKIGESMSGRRERRKRMRERWEDGRQDLRFTLRYLRRNLGYALVTVTILALAIGANIAVFTVVNQMLLRPLPFSDSKQLVWIAPPPETKNCGWSCATYSADAFTEFREQSRVYDDVTGYFPFSTPDNLRVAGHGQPQPATGVDVIGNFFAVMRVQPVLGRLFNHEEMRGGRAVVLLSFLYWKRHSGGDANIVGKAMNINGKPFTVIGVLPQTFDFGAVFSPGLAVDVFSPLDLKEAHDWGNIVTLIARLKPGMTLAQARGDARRVAPQLYFNTKDPASLGGYKDSIYPVPFKEHVLGTLRRPLIVLWCAVGTILLIAGLNLCNLLLASATARSREFAVRGALGASPARVLQQLFLESFVQCGAGASGGLLLAVVLIWYLAHRAAVALPLLSTLQLDGQALGWTLLLFVLTTVTFGVVAGLRLAGPSLQRPLQNGGGAAVLHRRQERVRAVLVVSEIALACVLLVSAGLLLRSFVKALQVNLGFEAQQAASIKVEYDDNAPTFVEGAAKRSVILQSLLEQVRTIPGVTAAGMTDYLPFGPNRQWGSPVPLGKTFAPGTLPSPLVYVVTPGFIRAMGIRLRGRDIAWSDTARTTPVALINESAARSYWPQEEAIGKFLVRGEKKIQIIGVVDDVREESVEGPVGSQMYYSTLQEGPDGGQLVIRTSLPPATLAPSVRRLLRAANPNQPAAEFRPIRMLVDRAHSSRRFFTSLVGAFAGLGLLLAALGIYGVISYSVSRRTAEIGVRMALGASAGRVKREVMAETLRLSLYGLTLGTFASVITGRLISSVLFATSPWDSFSYAAMVLLLTGVALSAGYVPAARASTIEPMSALRVS